MVVRLLVCFAASQEQVSFDSQHFSDLRTHSAEQVSTPSLNPETKRQRKRQWMTSQILFYYTRSQWRCPDLLHVSVSLVWWTTHPGSVLAKLHAPPTCFWNTKLLLRFARGPECILYVWRRCNSHLKAKSLFPKMWFLFKDGLRFRMCCYSPVSSSSTHFMHKNRAQCNFCSYTFLLCFHFSLLFFYKSVGALYWYLYIYVHVWCTSAGCGFSPRTYPKIFPVHACVAQI